jgi:hypothetical protein
MDVRAHYADASAVMLVDCLHHSATVAYMTSCILLFKIKRNSCLAIVDRMLSRAQCTIRAGNVVNSQLVQEHFSICALFPINQGNSVLYIVSPRHLTGCLSSPNFILLKPRSVHRICHSVY